MSFSEDQIRANYKGYRDTDLIRIAVQDAASLTPTALQILKDEITFRGLQNSESTKARFKILDKSVLEELCHSVQNCFCPNCNKQSGLNRIRVKTVVGAGHFSVKSTKYYILCKDCSKSLILKNTFYGFFLGVLTVFPWLEAINNNFYNLSFFKSDTPSPYLIDFVKAKYKHLELMKSDVFATSAFIKMLSQKKDTHNAIG